VRDVRTVILVALGSILWWPLASCATSSPESAPPIMRSTQDVSPRCPDSYEATKIDRPLKARGVTYSTSSMLSRVESSKMARAVKERLGGVTEKLKVVGPGCAAVVSVSTASPKIVSRDAHVLVLMRPRSGSGILHRPTTYVAFTDGRTGEVLALESWRRGVTLTAS
jgi:hypothetical protein